MRELKVSDEMEQEGLFFIYPVLKTTMERSNRVS
jgi:hypothetical protein